MRPSLLVAAIAASFAAAPFAASALSISSTPAVGAAPAEASNPPRNATRIGGRLYFTFSHIDATEHGARTDASGTGLDVKRFYLEFDHRFDARWSAHLTTDFKYAGNDGTTQLFVKKAYVQREFADLARLQIGAAATPWVPFAERWYGYRFVEKSLVDRAEFGNSADWGLHLAGERGRFDWQVSLLNGGGYKNPSRSRRMDVEARLGMQPISGLMLALGSYRGALGAATATTNALHTASRHDALIAWQRDDLRLGGEWFTGDNWNQVNALQPDSAAGWSLWGSYDFARVAVFARHDRITPSQQQDPQRLDRYWNAGIAMPLAKGVKLALVLKQQNLSNRRNIDIDHREFGVWGEFRW